MATPWREAWPLASPGPPLHCTWPAPEGGLRDQRRPQTRLGRNLFLFARDPKVSMRFSGPVSRMPTLGHAGSRPLAPGGGRGQALQGARRLGNAGRTSSDRVLLPSCSPGKACLLEPECRQVSFPRRLLLGGGAGGQWLWFHVSENPLNLIQTGASEKYERHRTASEYLSLLLPTESKCETTPAPGWVGS